MTKTTHLLAAAIVAGVMFAAALPAAAQTGRFLAKEDILIYGLGLRVSR